jgi:hypothetical protein
MEADRNGMSMGCFEGWVGLVEQSRRSALDRLDRMARVVTRLEADVGQVDFRNSPESEIASQRNFAENHPVPYISYKPAAQAAKHWERALMRLQCGGYA